MKIDYVCFTAHHGYAAAAKDYIKALIQGGHDVKISPLDLGFPKKFHSEDFKILNALIEKPFNSNRVQIFHCIPDMQRRFRNKKCGKTIGLATFETTDPPKPWIKILNMNTAVFVPSRFLFEVFFEAGIEKPMFYVPHGLDFKAYRPDQHLEVTCNQVFKFMFFGSWKKRKGGSELVQAYLSEFGGSDEVELIISGDQGGSIQADIKKLKKSFSGKKLPKISIEERIIPGKDVPMHLKRADCLVSPTMGEGFGLPGLQAMACGVPIIITGWSGCTEYATEKTATLLAPGKFVEIDFLDGIPQFRHKKWAYVSPGKIAEKMRYAYEHREEIRSKAKVGLEHVRANFSYDKVLEKIEEAFSFLGFF